MTGPPRGASSAAAIPQPDLTVKKLPRDDKARKEFWAKVRSGAFGVVLITALAGAFFVVVQAAKREDVARAQERASWYGECEKVKPRFECEVLMGQMCGGERRPWMCR
jgi:hypothetical protein